MSMKRVVVFKNGTDVDGKVSISWSLYQLIFHQLVFVVYYRMCFCYSSGYLSATIAGRLAKDGGEKVWHYSWTNILATRWRNWRCGIDSVSTTWRLLATFWFDIIVCNYRHTLQGQRNSVRIRRRIFYKDSWPVTEKPTLSRGETTVGGMDYVERGWQAFRHFSVDFDHERTEQYAGQVSQFSNLTCLINSSATVCSEPDLKHES